jgi:hypothetical protein
MGMTTQNCPKEEIARFSEILSSNKEVTLIGLSDFGYAYTTPVTIKEVTLCSYAQYDDAVRVTFRQKRKRKDSYSYFYTSYFHSTLPAIIAGHPDLKSGMQFNEPKSTSVEGVQISQAKYSSHDERNVTDILDDASDKVIFRPSKY